MNTVKKENPLDTEAVKNIDAIIRQKRQELSKLLDNGFTPTSKEVLEKSGEITKLYTEIIKMVNPL